MRFLSPSVKVMLALLASTWLVACSTQTPEEHLANALEYRAAGQDDAAIIELKNALQKDGGYLPARAEFARQLFASGDYSAAQSEFKRALALPVEESPLSRGEFAELFELSKLTAIRLQEAAAVLADLDEQAQAQPPLAPSARALLGLARLALDDIELAGQDFAAALAADADLPYANFGQARVLWAAGQLESAWPLFVKASRLAPRDPQLWLMQGEFALEQKNLDGAREAFAAARTLPGRDVPARLGQARVMIFEQDLNSAKAEIDEVLTLVPTYVPALYLRALVAYEQGEYKTAALALLEVQSLQPNYTAGLYLMGAVQFQLKDFAQSESNLKRYLDSQPGNVSSRKLLAAVLMQRQDYDGVVAALEPVPSAQKDAQLLAMLGTAYARTNRLSQASQLLDQAVALAPDVGQLRNQLAVTLLAAGESEQAIGALQSAIELDSEMMLSDYLLVLALLREGKADEALRAAQTLRDRAPDDPMGENLMGAVYFAQGDEDAARVAFKAALSKDSAFEPAVLNLVRLDVSQGDMAGAVAALNGLLAADPDNERALLRLAELALTDTGLTSDEAGKEAAIAKAVTLLQRADRAHTDSLAPKLALARLGLNSNNLTLADVQSERALSLAPEHETALLVRIEALLAGDRVEEVAGPLGSLATAVRRQQPVAPARLLELARLQERAGLVDEAIRSYSEAAEGGGDYFQKANLALTRFDLRSGSVVSARKRLLAAESSITAGQPWRLLAADVARAENNLVDAEKGYSALLEEGSREALFRLVALHTQAGEPSRGAVLLNEWLAKHSNDAGVEIALATAALSAGDYASSQQRFESALANDPNNVVVLNNLAYLYQQTDDARARPTARKAWELAPDNADVADTYGWILFTEGEVERSRDVLMTARELAPTNPWIGYHAAEALAATGRSERAIGILDRLTQPAAGTQGRTAFSGAPEFAQALALLNELRAVNDVDRHAEAEAELVE